MLKRKLRTIHSELFGIGTGRDDWDYFKKCIRKAWWTLEQDKIDKLVREQYKRVEAVMRIGVIIQNISEKLREFKRAGTLKNTFFF